MSTTLTHSPPEMIDKPVSDAFAVPPNGGAIEYELIELLFFAYRDFVGEADLALQRYGFGRAHHRVLHFVNRNPGLTIAALLDILRITKQSLSRVLRELVDGGFIEVRAGSNDRRQRLLFAAPKGLQLAEELALLQTRRIRRALEGAGPDGRAAAERFLLNLIDAPARQQWQQLARGAGNKD